MKKQARYHVNRKLSESDGEPAYDKLSRDCAGGL